jgi:hypothetical protein
MKSVLFELDSSIRRYYHPTRAARVGDPGTALGSVMRPLLLKLNRCLHQTSSEIVQRECYNASQSNRLILKE